MTDELVLAAIEAYEHKNLSEYILKLILDPIKGLDLKNIWHIIPANLKKGYENKLPCTEHYNQPWQTTHIDGPPPPRYLCSSCMYNLSSVIIK